MFIDIKDARKHYGEGETLVNALDGVSLSLGEGRIYVILGPSGSGKSTLLNMIGGLDSLDSGEITISGRNISRSDKKKMTDYRREDVGFVFQFYNLIPDLTVQENIQVVADIAKQPMDIEEVMKALDIDKYKNRFPKELSGGQQQRVAIARALIKNPKILLCDELTGALDSKSSRNVLKFIEKVNEQFKTTIIIITHNEAIADMADTVIRIKDGQVASCIDNNSKHSAEELEL
jgi:putative ABC transport system ATP-binding protein|uniref:ABC transporter ATP-binding protein n=1 Tax=Lachnospira eligens TaxID=39485 RepID=UPI004026CF59